VSDLSLDQDIWVRISFYRGFEKFFKLESRGYVETKFVCFSDGLEVLVGLDTNCPH